MKSIFNNLGRTNSKCFMPLKSSHGFTLLEALISLGLTVVISSAVITYYYNVSKSYNVLDSSQVKCVAELEHQADMLVPDKSMTYAPLSVGPNGEMMLYSSRDDKQAIKAGRIKPSLVKEIYAIEMEKTKTIPTGLYKGPQGKDIPTSPIFRDDGLPVLHNHLLLKGALAQLTNIYHDFQGDVEDICITGIATDKIFSSYNVGGNSTEVKTNLLKDFTSQAKLYPIFGRSQDDKRTEIFCPRPFVPTASQTISGGGRVFKIPNNAIPDGGFVLELTGSYVDLAGVSKKCSVTRKFYQGTDNTLTQPESYARVIDVYPKGMDYKSKTPPQIFKQDFLYGFPKITEYTVGGEKKYSVDSALTENSCRVAGSNAVISRHAQKNPLEVMQKYEVTLEVGTAPNANTEPGTLMLCKDRSQQLAAGWLNRSNRWVKPGESNYSWVFDYDQLEDQTKWVPCDRVTLCGVPSKSAKFIPDPHNPYNLKYELKFESSEKATPGVRDAFYGCDLKMDVALVDPAGNSSALGQKKKIRSAGAPDLKKLIEAPILETFFQPHNAFTCKFYKRDVAKIIKFIISIQLVVLKFIFNVVCNFFSGGGCAAAEMALKVVQITQTIYATYQMIEAITHEPPPDVPVGETDPTVAADPVVLLDEDTFFRMGQAADKMITNNRIRNEKIVAAKAKGQGYVKFKANELQPIYDLGAPLTSEEYAYSMDRTMREQGLNFPVGSAQYNKLYERVKAAADKIHKDAAATLVMNEYVDLNMNAGKFKTVSPSSQEDFGCLDKNGKKSTCVEINARDHVDGRASVERIVNSYDMTARQINGMLMELELDQLDKNVAAAQVKIQNLMVGGNTNAVRAEINANKEIPKNIKDKLLESVDAKDAANTANYNKCASLNVGNTAQTQNCYRAIQSWEQGMSNQVNDFYAHPEKMLISMEQWNGMSEDQKKELVTKHALQRQPAPRSKDLCTNSGDGIPCAGQSAAVVAQNTAEKVYNTVAVVVSAKNQIKQAKQLADAVKRGDDKNAVMGAWNLATTSGGLLSILGVGDKSTGQNIFGLGFLTKGNTGLEKYNPIEILVNGFDGKGGIASKMSNNAVNFIASKIPINAVQDFISKNGPVMDKIGNGVAKAIAQLIIQIVLTGDDIGKAIKAALKIAVEAYVYDFLGLDMLKGTGTKWKVKEVWQGCVDESGYRKRKKWNPFDDEKTECAKRSDIQLPKWILNKDYPSCLVTQFNFKYPDIGASGNEILNNGRQRLDNGTVLIGRQISYQNQKTFMTRESLIDGKFQAKEIDFQNGLLFDSEVKCLGGKNSDNSYYANWSYPKAFNESDPTTYDEADVPVAAVCPVYNTKYCAARGRGCRDPNNWVFSDARTCPEGSVPARDVFGGAGDEGDMEALAFYGGSCIKINKSKIPKNENQSTSVMLTKVAYKFNKGADGRISSFQEVSDDEGACVAAFDVETTETLPTAKFVKEEYEFCDISGQNPKSLCKLVVFAKYKSTDNGVGESIDRAMNMFNQGPKNESDFKTGANLKYVDWQAGATMTIARFNEMKRFVSDQKSILNQKQGDRNRIKDVKILDTDPNKVQLRATQAEQLRVVDVEIAKLKKETERKLRIDFKLEIPYSSTEGGDVPDDEGDYTKYSQYQNSVIDGMHVLYEIADLWYVLKRPEDIRVKAKKLYKSTANTENNIIHMFEYRIPVSKTTRWCFSGVDIQAAKIQAEKNSMYTSSLRKAACLSKRAR